MGRQRERGRTWLVGDAPSAVDIYWATFAAMLQPLLEAVCPMPGPIRAGYTLRDAEALSAEDRLLLEHRDLVYRELLTLPLDF